MLGRLSIPIGVLCGVWLAVACSGGPPFQSGACRVAEECDDAGAGGEATGNTGSTSARAGAGGKGGSGNGGAPPGNAGSASGGAPSAGDGGGHSGGGSSGPFYTLWASLALDRRAVIAELDPQTGDVIDTVIVTDLPGAFALDIAAASDGNVRLLWAGAVPSCGLWIFDSALQYSDARVYSESGGIGAFSFTKAADGTARLITQRADTLYSVGILSEADLPTGKGFSFASDIGAPLDFWVLANGTGRLLTAPEENQTLVRFTDVAGGLTGESLECQHPGWNAASYSVDRRGVVWVSYVGNAGGRVCAFASEAEFSCDLSQDGWGAGSCRTYAAPEGFGFTDLAIAP